jgi:hypothetical protein
VKGCIKIDGQQKAKKNVTWDSDVKKIQIYNVLTEPIYFTKLDLTDEGDEDSDSTR